MTFQCENCQSLFFKTLETRVSPEHMSILYKKRCKRCKYKYVVRKPIAGGVLVPASRMEWLEGVKVNLPVSEKHAERPKIMVGEYTRRISNPADETMPYYRKISRAEQGELHDAS